MIFISFVNIFIFNRDRIVNHSNSHIVINGKKLLPRRRLVGKKGRERERGKERDRDKHFFCLCLSLSLLFFGLWEYHSFTFSTTIEPHTCFSSTLKTNFILYKIFFLDKNTCYHQIILSIHLLRCY